MLLLSVLVEEPCKVEWESESEPEEDAPRYDEDIKHDEGEEIQPDEGDNNCFVSR